MAKVKMEPWEEELLRQAEAIRKMNSFVGQKPRTFKRVPRAVVATLSMRDKAATHVGFAKDRPYG